MSVTLVCARLDCQQAFKRVTCQKYCSIACRKADRQCSRCKKSLPLDMPGDRTRYCRECDAELGRIRRGLPEEREKAMDAHRFRKYGLSREAYLAKLMEQDGLCASCGREETAKRKFLDELKVLAVDHNATTGAVRGLLCQRCNTALGLLQEDESAIEGLLLYLRRYTL